MNVLSLFDGISCSQLALQSLGITPENYCASEIDEKAMMITRANFPDTDFLGTINNWNDWNLPEIDLLIAGFPCQDLSLMGKRAGLRGERSGLFYKALNCLIKFRPKYFLFENVVMKKEEMDNISNMLGVQPIKINSSLLTGGNRKRLYWTNIEGIEQPKDKKINFQSILESGYTDRKKSLCIPASYGKGSNLKMYFEKRRGQLVFDPKCPKGHRLLTPNECEKLAGIPIDYTDSVAKTHRYHGIGNGFTIPVIAHILENMESTY